MKQKSITAQIRPIETYSPKYLRNKNAIYQWAAANKDRVRHSVKLNARVYRERYPLTMAERAFFQRLKKTLRVYFEGGKVRPTTLEKIKAKTGQALPDLIKHLGYDLAAQWVYGGRSFHLDHIIPLTRLEKAGLMDKASHYTNLRITLRQINQSWGCRINDKTSDKAVEALVRLSLKQSIGLN